MDAVVARRSEISEATRALIEKGIGDGSIEPSNSKLATLFHSPPPPLGAVNWIPLWYREYGPHTPDEIVEEFARLLKRSLVAAPAFGLNQMNRQQLWEQFAGFSRFILLSIGFCNNLLDRFPPFTDRAPIQLWNCFQERPIGRNILSGNML